jgi:5'-phosphate synthase pdxT subunit
VSLHLLITLRVERRPTWGTCAGLILLAEAANRTKKGGQELIGGLDVRVNRNHFGRQVESFETDINLSFLQATKDEGVARDNSTFKAFFIRAPVVEKILPTQDGIQISEAEKPDTVVAPSQRPKESVTPGLVNARVEILATVPKRGQPLLDGSHNGETQEEDIVAVRQGNVFGTSFHPELTDDARIHVWWLEQVRATMLKNGSL